MLGELLTYLRTRAGLTVPDVVEQLRVPRATAYSWETPGGRPAPESLQRLLDLYEASDEERLEAWRLRALPSTDNGTSGDTPDGEPSGRAGAGEAA